MRKIELPPITRSKLVTDLGKLGVSIGNTIMLHASVRAIGWIVGGPDVVIQALLDVLGAQGTLIMYVGWEDSPYDLAKWFKIFSKHIWKNAHHLTPLRLVHTESGAS